MSSFADSTSTDALEAGGTRRSLAELTTARVGGCAELLAEPKSLAECVDRVERARAEGVHLRILGGGTNVLPPDEDVAGLVLSTRGLTGVDWRPSGVVAEAGVSTAKLVSGAAERGLAGLERMAGVPGTIGGAAFGNAGTRHGWLGDILRRVQVIDRDGAIRWLSRDEVRPRYRATDLGGRVVLAVDLELTTDTRDDVRARLAAMQDDRKKTQPAGRGSLGCFFRNPEGESAGALIDRAGLKGESCGGVRVSERHANFLVNDGDSCASDFVELACRIRRRVWSRFGIRLEPEVRVWNRATRDGLPGEDAPESQVPCGKRGIVTSRDSTETP